MVVSKRSRSKRHDGFTLIEVLIALAVLAIALAAVIRTVGQAINHTAALRDRVVALGIAQDRLAGHRLLRDWPNVGTASGTREQGGREWRWQETVSGTDSPQLRRIEIEVRDANDKEVLAVLVGTLRQAKAP